MTIVFGGVERMKQIALKTFNEVDTQIRNLLISPNGNSVSLRVTIHNRKKSGRWYMSIFDVLNQKDLVTNVPILTSYSMLNGLICQFRYMNIGTAYVLAISSMDSKKDPQFDNITDYQIVWSDGVG